MPPKQHIDILAIEKNYRIEEDGAVWSCRKNKYIKPIYNTAGYLYVSITIGNEHYKMIAVHRLVATKYIGQCPPKLETSHKDGSRTNNHYTNLEYLTHQQNILKSYKEHGRIGVANHYPRMPFSDVTKALMSDAKKKRVRHTHNGIETIYNSIDDASRSLNTYRKKVYRCIYSNIAFKDKHNPNIGGFLSFIDTQL